LWIAGCGSGIGEPESKMTSYTANESASDAAELFTVPQQEMAHIKVVSVEKTRLQRVLRLTRSVSYNQFKTIPVFPAIGGRPRNSRRPSTSCVGWRASSHRQ